MLYFILGIIVGILLSLIGFFSTRKISESPPVQRMLRTNPLFRENPGEAFIVGLSEDEQNFRDHLPDKI